MNEGPKAGGKTRGQGDGIARCRCIETEQVGAGRCSANRAAGAGRVPPETVMRVITAGRFQNAAPDIIACDHSGDHPLAVHRSAYFVQCREQGRQHHGAGMVAAAGIVQLESMRGTAVENCSVTGRGGKTGSPQRDGTGGSK
ncbi:hypothetical protein D3C80_812210 [compost metagenome]